MKFLIDESADARVAAHLRHLGHDVKLVAQDYTPGLPDEQVLALAHGEQQILVTDDKDFGQLVFEQRHPHTGVIFFRLSTTVLRIRLARLDYVLDNYSDRLDQFLTVTEHSVRLGRTITP